MILSLLLLYLLIGVALVIAGPAKESISREIEKTRFRALADEIQGRGTLSERGLFVYRLILALGVFLFWPLLLPGIVRENRLKADESTSKVPQAQEGIEFQRMGGCGTVSCSQCTFKEDIISFLHGENDNGEEISHSGYQCLECGKFTDVSRIRNTKQDNDVRCNCGGKLSREHVLFCPTCRSKDLSYRTKFIT